VRVLLLTGKGGVGKTTAAAGTAMLGAMRGGSTTTRGARLRTLVLSTDAARPLADAFDTRVGPEPTHIEDGLFVQQVDTQRRFEASWGAFQGYLLAEPATVSPAEVLEVAE
jgi:arsenite/tail-anchored protein-transporting ATPase